MDKIVFITHHMGTQGSFINHLDLQKYLKEVEGYEIKFYCENVKSLFDVIKTSKRKYEFKKGEIKLLKSDNIIEMNTVITDFKTLISLNNLNISVICKKLLIMDCIELSYHLKEIKNARFYYDVDIRNLIRHTYAKEILFLMPPNNVFLFNKKYPDLTCICFFKHINVDALNTIEHKNLDGYFYRWDVKDNDDQIKKEFGENCFSYPPTWTTNATGSKVPLKYNEADHIFDYKNLIYRRRSYLEYEEQFGRLIFEYILLGKTVYFLNEKHTDDGLTDYLNHFDIKFEGKKVTTTGEELAEKMKVYTEKPWEI
jgi:hypothetical protein